MKLVNNLMKAPEMAATMQELSKEMMKVFLLVFIFTYKMAKATVLFIIDCIWRIKARIPGLLINSLQLINLVENLSLLCNGIWMFVIGWCNGRNGERWVGFCSGQ